MNPQGTTILNTDVFANLTAAINAAPDCEALAALVAKSFLSIGALNAAMATEQAKLQPMLALLTVPATNPAAIVTWIGKLITLLITPMVQPALDYAATIEALVVQVATLTAAIEAAQAKFESCSITIPTVTIITVDPGV